MLTVTLDNIDNLDYDNEEITIKIRKMCKDITNLPVTLKKVILSFEDSLYLRYEYFLYTTDNYCKKYYLKLPFDCKLFLQEKNGINEITNFSGYIYEKKNGDYYINNRGDLFYRPIITIELPSLDYKN